MCPWFLEGVSARERATKEWPIVQMADGSTVALRSVVVRGCYDGPILYIGAAIHGNEVCGIEVMRRLLACVDLEQLYGVLVMIPIQNPWGFLERQRFLPTHAFDVFREDISDAFPGSPNGEVSQVTAHAILEGFVQHCDFAVGLHAAMTGGTNLDYCFTPAGPDPRVKEARRLARAFLLPMVIEQDAGTYVRPTQFHQVATLAGTPSFCVEFREAGRVTQQSTERGVAGFLNIMRFTEMLRDQPAQLPERQYIARDSVYVRAERGGMYVPEAPLGSEVQEGDRLGTLYALDFSWEEALRSPTNGLLHRTAVHGPINSSERIAAIGTK